MDQNPGYIGTNFTAVPQLTQRWLHAKEKRTVLCLSKWCHIFIARGKCKMAAWAKLALFVYEFTIGTARLEVLQRVSTWMRGLFDPNGPSLTQIFSKTLWRSLLPGPLLAFKTLVASNRKQTSHMPASLLQNKQDVRYLLLNPRGADQGSYRKGQYWA